jgi:hypothetical protein
VDLLVRVVIAYEAQDVSSQLIGCEMMQHFPPVYGANGHHSITHQLLISSLVIDFFCSTQPPPPPSKEWNRCGPLMLCLKQLPPDSHSCGTCKAMQVQIVQQMLPTAFSHLHCWCLKWSPCLPLSAASRHQRERGNQHSAERKRCQPQSSLSWQHCN